MIALESNVPMSPRYTSRLLQRYPLRRMAVGDSFPMSVDDPRFDSHRRLLYRYARQAGVKVSVRKVGAGYRCWRTA